MSDNLKELLLKSWGTVSKKFHVLVDRPETRIMGFMCSVINMLEDVLEDATCEDVKVDLGALHQNILVVKGVKCKENISESVEAYGERYEIDARIGEGDVSYRRLYDTVLELYFKQLRPLIRQYLPETLESGVEYYLSVLFDGKGFIAEGDIGRVKLPFLKECFSAHTHPSPQPVPSERDIETIIKIMLERGLGHSIEASAGSLILIRTRPIRVEDLATLREIEKEYKKGRLNLQLFADAGIKIFHSSH